MRILVYGGSGSGKSAYAERIMPRLGGTGRLWYIATMRPDGREAVERIARHQAARAHKGFTTVEIHAGLERLALPDDSPALLECVGNLLANEMFAPEGRGAEAIEALWLGLEALGNRTRHLVAVTNDVFADGVGYPPETEAYRRGLAEINLRLASASDMVVEMVCGIPLFHKSPQEADPCWP